MGKWKFLDGLSPISQGASTVKFMVMATLIFIFLLMVWIIVLKETMLTAPADSSNRLFGIVPLE